MAEIKWIKISCDLFNDEAIRLIEQMPDGDAIIVIWLKLLIMAGKINDNGFLYFKKEIPYTDEMLSTVFNRPLNTIRLALNTFERFGMIQITTERGIYITNWEKYQNIEGMERAKELAKMRKRKQRAREKALLLETKKDKTDVTLRDGHVTVTALDIDIDKDKELDKDISFYIDTKKDIQEETKNTKKDPYINPIKKFVVEEYTKIFKTKPFLSNQDCMRIVELSSEYEDIRELITIALKKLKDIRFEDINFKPSINWLLKCNNFERVLNGEFDSDIDTENSEKKELREQMEREGRL